VYNPQHFREERIEILHGLIRAHSLATLVTLNASGLEASHVPLLLDPDPAPRGTLRGHFSRANPQWRDFSADVPALAIFSGPQHYVSPSWYPSKREHGRVVPTWNYAVVHAYGPLRLIEDEERLRGIVRELTRTHEAGSERPWNVEDAPKEFVDGQLKAIIGIEMAIERLEGKWKVSQNRPEADRAGVAAALRSLGGAESAAMGDLVDRAAEEERR
jgi:transcriptional regulator